MAFPHGKDALTDPGLHLPPLVRWPGVVRPGSATRELISAKDFAPTVLDAAGVRPPGTMSGQGFLKLLRGESFDGRHDIFAERGPRGGDGAMRPNISAATFDLARCARSACYKPIYDSSSWGIQYQCGWSGESTISLFAHFA